MLAIAAHAAAPAEPARETVRTTSAPILVDADWDLLLPANERQSPPEPPPPLHNYLGEGSPAAKQTGSAAVNAKLDGQLIKIPGFIVPLSEDSEGLVTEFFLVPYVGACIHVPPPPPNQIVYVKPMEPVQAPGLGDAYWVTGRMHVQTRNTPLASAAYSITADKVVPYTYDKK